MYPLAIDTFLYVKYVLTDYTPNTNEPLKGISPVNLEITVSNYYISQTFSITS